MAAKAKAKDKKAEKQAQEAQLVLNQLVTAHGYNIRHRSDGPDLLKAAGLLLKDITDLMWDKADEAAKKQVEKDFTEGKLTWLPPVQEVSDAGNKFQVWTTRCGKYRIVRAEGPEARFLAITKTGKGKKMQEEIVKNDLKSLQAALDAVDKYHTAATSKETVSNRSSIEGDAKKTGLDRKAAQPSANGEGAASSAEGGGDKPASERKPRVRNSGGPSSNDQVLAYLLAHKGEPQGHKDIVKATGLTPKQVRYGYLHTLVAEGRATFTRGEGFTLIK